MKLLNKRRKMTKESDMFEIIEHNMKEKQALKHQMTFTTVGAITDIEGYESKRENKHNSMKISNILFQPFNLESAEDEGNMMFSS